MSKPEVIILVGPSGCGKSTWVEQFQWSNKDRAVSVCSADRYHLIKVGDKWVYKFDPTKSPMAHSQCMNEFLEAIVSPVIDFVIVDNTNISEWERQNYVQAAENAGCKVCFEIWQVTTVQQIKQCAGRNRHGVPIGVVADMALRYEMPNGKHTLHFHQIVGEETAS